MPKISNMGSQLVNGNPWGLCKFLYTFDFRFSHIGQIKVCPKYNIHYICNIYIIQTFYIIYLFYIFKENSSKMTILGQIKVFPTYNIYYIDNIYNRKKNSSNMTILGIYCCQRENYTTSFTIFILFCILLHFFGFVSILLFFLVLCLSYIFCFISTLIIIGIMSKLDLVPCLCFCPLH